MLGVLLQYYITIIVSLHTVFTILWEIHLCPAVTQYVASA